MVEFLWGTDLHLDFLKTDDYVRDWAEENFSQYHDAVVLTGDTSLAPLLVHHLKIIRECSGKKVYFVLGNHDAWDGSIEKLRVELENQSLKDEGIVWLGSEQFVPVGNYSALVGHDGWYDALNGDYKNSRFAMNDWFRIREFVNLKCDLVDYCRKLASQSSLHVGNACKSAISAGRKNIVVATHFPPFAEACFHKENPTEETVLPWYSSKTMGDTLLKLSKEHPDVKFTVVCGHTHSYADVSISENLRVVVGGAVYGLPRIFKLGIET